MENILAGIHHITAITADPQPNIDFYTGVLGLRIVKLTVNFDDPGSYHLYFGDELGRPGTILTFFVWPGAVHNSQTGPPQVTAIAFQTTAGALPYWQDRLSENHLQIEPVIRRFGEQLLPFRDPDGIGLEIVARELHEAIAPAESHVPQEYALRGFYGLTLSQRRRDPTAQLLTEVMGYRPADSANGRFRYRAAQGKAAVVDIITDNTRHGDMGAGIVHHVAFRTPDDERQLAWRDRLLALGLNVTPVIDRQYFHSIYFREPGGVLFEIATDPPGFTLDERPDELGQKLMLPAWLEPYRSQMESLLPPLRLPEYQALGHA